jgi:hypothetical protein
MDDRQLRTAVKQKMLRSHSQARDTRIIDELGLQHGASRVDLALVNGRIHGFELKSDRDTLARLGGQMEVYNSVLDRVTLVVVPRHCEAARRIVPDWWGIKVADLGKCGGIHFHSLRKALDNSGLVPLCIAQLLWREEAMTLLTRLGAAEGMARQRRESVFARVAEVAPLQILREHVRTCLRMRRAWRFERP